MQLPRWCHRLYALLRGYSWDRCCKCGRMHGGHEHKKDIIKGWRYCNKC